ncbi:hypothetical protein GC175_16605 [bacterium]|nr:hypothetical protein [bacterium]
MYKWDFVRWAIVTLMTAFVTLSGTLAVSLQPAQAQELPFLITPYFGAKNITSYFDHEYPTYQTNQSIVIYTGERRTPASIENCLLGFSCYDGHNGTDFSMFYEPVIAAAAGTVTRSGWFNPNDRTTLMTGLVVMA